MVHLLLLQMGTEPSLEPLRVVQPISPAMQDMFCLGLQASDVCPLDTGQGVRLHVYVSIILTAYFRESVKWTNGIVFELVSCSKVAETFNQLIINYYVAKHPELMIFC